MTMSYLDMLDARGEHDETLAGLLDDLDNDWPAARDGVWHSEEVAA